MTVKRQHAAVKDFSFSFISVICHSHPYPSIHISTPGLLTSHLRELALAVAVKHKAGMIVSNARQTAEVLDRDKAMLLTIVGDDEQFLRRLLWGSAHLPGAAAATTFILIEELPVKLLGRPHIKASAHHLTGRNAVAFMKYLVIGIAFSSL